MKTLRSYQDLDVWRNSVDLAESIYRITSRFPDEERYGLSSQLRRAAVSVAANIAEGAERDGNNEYVRFLSIARGSLAEVETHLLLSNRLEIAQAEQVEELLLSTAEIGRMLNGLKRSLRG